MGDELRSDPDLVLAALEQRWTAFADAGAAARSTPSLVLQAVAVNSGVRAAILLDGVRPLSSFSHSSIVVSESETADICRCRHSEKLLIISTL